MRLTTTCLLLLLTVLMMSCQESTTPAGKAVSSITNTKIDPIFPVNNSDTTGRLKFTSGVRSILEDSHGNTWFGGYNEGLARLSNGKLTYYTTENGLSGNQVRSIYEAEDGTVWFECGKGLSFFDGKTLAVKIGRDYNYRNKWKAEPGDLWFKGDPSIGYSQSVPATVSPNLQITERMPGEQSPGVYRYGGKELQYHAFSMLAEAADGNSYSISTPFARGRNNQVWFGMYSAVIGYDGNTFTVFTNDSLNLNKTTGYLHVRSLYEDSQGILWIGNNGIGVLRYDGEEMINFSKQQMLVPLNSQNRGGAPSPAGSLEHVFAIGEDQNGNIWFGDRDTGAWRYNGKSMKNYTKKDGLPVPFIWQIYNAKNGELWFAMADGSVQRFNGKGFERVF